MLQTELITKRREIQTELRDHIEQLRKQLVDLAIALPARKIKIQALIDYATDHTDVVESFTIEDAEVVKSVIDTYVTALESLPQI